VHTFLGDKRHPSCQRCLKGGYDCIYRKQFESSLLNKFSEPYLHALDRAVREAQQLNVDLDEETRRQLDEIERMKKAKNQLVVRSVMLYKCSQLIYMLNCYMPALQPTTGNQVPYIKISHFFRDTNPARQGAMFAMLANAALMLEDTPLAARFTAEAKNCLKIAGEPTEHNMAQYVSALIDLGTQHQAFFNFEAAIEIYYKIRDYAEAYPHLFLAALKKKRNEQRTMAFQGDRFQVVDLQEKEHYRGLFGEMRTAESSGYENSNDNSPNMPKNMEEDDGSDPDMNPDDDGKTTYAVPSYALPRTAEESLLFHLGYAFEALMLMTRDKELETIRKEIKESNEDKLGEHNVFNEIRERLQDLNQIATFCLKRGLIMKWDWFKEELDYIERRLLEVEMGRRIFLHGQKKLVVIHGLMASHKKEEALPLLEELIMFGVNQFYYGKTNVLGYGYLFSACVCYKFLHEHALFDQTRALIESYKVPDIPLAERCLKEIDKFVAGQEKDLAPYFAKLAAILEVDRFQQTKFTLLEITDHSGELTEEARHYFPKEFAFKSHIAYTNNNSNNNIQPQGPLSCESSPHSYYEADQLQTPYTYSNNNTQDAYNTNIPFVPSPHHHATLDQAYGMVHEQDQQLQARHEEHSFGDNFGAVMHSYLSEEHIAGHNAPHLMQNTPQVPIGSPELSQFYVVPDANNNNNMNVFGADVHNSPSPAFEEPADLFTMDFEQDSQEFPPYQYENNLAE
jgi:hypothetical protein